MGLDAMATAMNMRARAWLARVASMAVLASANGALSACASDEGETSGAVDGADDGAGDPELLYEIAGGAAREDSPIRRRVVVLQYDPINPSNPNQSLSQAHGWPNIFDHSEKIAGALRDVSGKVADFQIVEKRIARKFPVKQDGFRYDWASYEACRKNKDDCHFPDGAAYAPMMDGDFGVDFCARIASGDIDEIWVWGAGYFGFDEFAFKIPGDRPKFEPQPYNPWIYDLRKKDLPACGRTYFVMGYIPERTEGLGLHSFGHRAESALTASAPARGRWKRCGAGANRSEWTDFTCVEIDGPGKSGCGDVHHAPNTTHDYSYDSLGWVQSTCEDWRRYPAPATNKTWVNATTWENPRYQGEDQFLSYWYDHMPRYPGSHRSGGVRVLDDWWDYILCYDGRCARGEQIVQHLVRGGRVWARSNKSGWSEWVDITSASSVAGSGDITGFATLSRPCAGGQCSHELVVRGGRVLTRMRGPRTDTPWEAWKDSTSIWQGVGAGRFTGMNFSLRRDGQTVAHVVRGGAIWANVPGQGWQNHTQPLMDSMTRSLGARPAGSVTGFDSMFRADGTVTQKVVVGGHVFVRDRRSTGWEPWTDATESIFSRVGSGAFTDFSASWRAIGD